jgi:hypothetical protein
MNNKIEIGVTLEEVAKSLTDLAKLTANGSKNWDNYRELCLDVLKQVEKKFKP